MVAGRWIAGGLLCCLFAGSSWYAVRALCQVRQEHARVAAINAALRRAHRERRLLDQQRERVRAAAALLQQANKFGLDPAGWMLSPFFLDTGRELALLLEDDPLLKRLRLEKQRIAAEQEQVVARIKASKYPAVERDELLSRAAAQADALQQRLEERVRLRTRWVEAQARYTAPAALALLRELSDPAKGIWFAPESFELTRVSGQQYEVRARGTFLAPRAASNGVLP